MTVRGGDLNAYAQMKLRIEETGDADLSVMDGTTGTKSSQTLRSFLYAMLIDNNI